jgi:hypothetical protein
VNNDKTLLATRTAFPILGIGASAGVLMALELRQAQASLQALTAAHGSPDIGHGLPKKSTSF